MCFVRVYGIIYSEPKAKSILVYVMQRDVCVMVVHMETNHVFLTEILGDSRCLWKMLLREKPLVSLLLLSDRFSIVYVSSCQKIFIKLNTGCYIGFYNQCRKKTLLVHLSFLPFFFLFI